MDFDNYLRVSGKEISEWVNLKISNVSRAMKALKKLGIIVEGPAAGKFKTYRLNPDIAHKGKDRKNTIMEFDKFRKKKFKDNDFDEE